MTYAFAANPYAFPALPADVSYRFLEAIALQQKQGLCEAAGYRWFQGPYGVTCGVPSKGGADTVPIPDGNFLQAFWTGMICRTRGGSIMVDDFSGRPRCCTQRSEYGCDVWEG